MNGYIAYWKGKTCEVHAGTSYAAQQAAVPIFQKQAGRKKVKSCDVSVDLCILGTDTDAPEQVIHRAVD